MNSIKEITNYLFDIDYWSDDYDETENERFEILEKLLSDYPWKDIWNEWVLYLIEKCTTSRDIENYLDLLFAYEISKQFIPNPIDFAGYLYHRIGNDLLIGDLQHMMDSVIIPILQHQGLLDYYDNCIAPEADSRIKASIDKFDKLSYEINDINSLNVAIFNMISFD